MIDCCSYNTVVNTLSWLGTLGKSQSCTGSNEEKSFGKHLGRFAEWLVLASSGIVPGGVRPGEVGLTLNDLCSPNMPAIRN